jgi:hypothetical protein
VSRSRTVRPQQKAALRARSQVELARFSEELDSGAAAAVSEDAAASA